LASDGALYRYLMIFQTWRSAIELFTSLGDVLSWSDLMLTDGQTQNFRLVFGQSQSRLDVFKIRHIKFAQCLIRRRSAAPLYFPNCLCFGA
jgi:hypothetical protein